MTDKKKSLVYALTAVLLWSTVATAFKLTLLGMNNVQLLFYASLTSFFVLFIIARRNSPGDLNLFFTKQHIKKNVLHGFINPFVYYLILFEAYRILPAQEAQPINLIWPLILSIMSVIFLKQKLSVPSIVGLIVSFIGVSVVATRGNLLSFQFHNLTGDLLALLSSFVWSGYWIINLLDKREESIKLVGSFFFGTIYTGLYILFFDSFDQFEIKYLFGAVYIGLFEMGITFFLWLKAISLSENKAKTANLIYLFPVISFSMIALILGEKIYMSSVAGLLLIIGGILVQQLNKEIFFNNLSALLGIFTNKFERK